MSIVRAQIEKGFVNRVHVATTNDGHEPTAELENCSSPHDALLLRELRFFHSISFVQSSIRRPSLKTFKGVRLLAAKATLRYPLVKYDRNLAMVIKGKESHPTVTTLYFTLTWRTRRL